MNRWKYIIHLERDTLDSIETRLESLNLEARALGSELDRFIFKIEELENVYNEKDKTLKQAYDDLNSLPFKSETDRVENDALTQKCNNAHQAYLNLYRKVYSLK